MKNFINQQDMKEINVADVFSLIKNRGAMTRKHIAERLGISWGAVSTITSKLIEEGYIIERKAEGFGTAGRIPSYLEVNRSRHFAIGLDVNDMGLYAVLVDLTGEVIEEYHTESFLESREALLERRGGKPALPEGGGIARAVGKPREGCTGDLVGADRRDARRPCCMTHSLLLPAMRQR